MKSRLSSLAFAHPDTVLRSFAVLRMVAVGAALGLVALVRADDGYRLWLRYDRITDEALVRNYAAVFAAGGVTLSFPQAAPTPTVAAAGDELVAGIRELTGTTPAVHLEAGETVAALGDDGYALRVRAGRVVIAANRDTGALYGAFALLRHLQLQQPLGKLDVVSVPKIQRRMLNHWDNLNRTVERGYAGQSIWEWFVLPEVVSPRYRDYARACASIGLNGTVLTNVNSDAQLLTGTFLRKVAAIADVLRPYGVRVYLSVRWSAPIEIGGLTTADPLDAGVIRWWHDKVAEIYRAVPDFGGFLVKANSEGQPGPQNYRRSHADGANLLAEAVAPHHGIVIWRAFVYEATGDDRAKQAFSEFTPLDGRFRDNVLVQVKNGPIDFMPREPFHPLFGAMPRTPLVPEVQITQEYLGQGTQLAFLAPMWRELLSADTGRPTTGATVARVVDGSLDHHRVSAIAGVANVGSDRNWTGHPLAQANWYAFGRLAWDHSLTSAQIADEWTRQTFANDARVVSALVPMLLESREAVVNYSMPLGLHHLMATGHHYGPGPWVGDLSRADWNPVYYHRADEKGVGFDRTVTGSNALAQYAPAAAKVWADPATCPDEFLLWFHHVPWDYRMRSGRSLWDELCLHYQRGVDTVRTWRQTWDALRPLIDAERFAHVQGLLVRQERDAREWRDACTQYFATFSKRPRPAGVEPPEQPLENYRAAVLRYTPGWSPGR